MDQIAPESVSQLFFFSSRRRHTRLTCDWSSDVCSSDLSWPRSFRLSLSRASGSTSNAHRVLLPIQIGRASCRERVYIRVVCGAESKKIGSRHIGHGRGMVDRALANIYSLHASEWDGCHT